MAIAFDHEFFGRFDGANFGHASHIIAPQIQQHQMFGQLFLIGQQVQFQGIIFLRCGATGAGARNGAHGDLIAKHTDQNFGAGPDHLKIAKVEIEHKGRWIRAPQRAIQRKRRQAEILGPALG